MGFLDTITGWVQKQNKELQLKREMHEAVQGLVDNSTLTYKFMVMSILSGIVAMCGIILRDTSILIAAMVLAPLLNPLLSIGAGLVLGHNRLVLFAMKAFVSGFAAVIAITSVLAFFLHQFGVPLLGALFLAKFNQPHVLPVLLIVSFVSGFGAVYSWIKNASSANFVGVAIAVALIPFVALYGVLIGGGEWHMLSWLTVIFGSNMVSIVLGAVLGFLVLGLKLDKTVVDKEIENGVAGT